MLPPTDNRRRSQPIQWFTLLAILAALASCVSEWLAIRRARLEAAVDEQRLEQMLVLEQRELTHLQIETSAILDETLHGQSTPPRNPTQPPAKARQ